MDRAAQPTPMERLPSKIKRLIQWSQDNGSPKAGEAESTTVGVHTPPLMRERLKHIEKKHNLRNYRSAVYLTILAGLDALAATDE